MVTEMVVMMDVMMVIETVRVRVRVTSVGCDEEVGREEVGRAE
jgi:hypothetical protein